MVVLRLLHVILLLILFVPACSRTDDGHQSPVFKQIPEIQEIKPERTAKIKLKRNAKDDYSWEISSDDVDEIIKADKRLKENLKTE